MRIATYNHQMGWDGRCPVLWAKIFWHYVRRNCDHLERGANIQPTIEVIEEVSPDIIAIQEVLGVRQALSLKQALRDRGYTSFALGNGRILSNDHTVHTLTASRIPAQHISIPRTDAFGPTHEGGFGGLHLPEHDLSIVNLHLPIFDLRRLQKFNNHTHKVLENICPKAKCILLGDFNSRHKSIRKHVKSLQQWEKISTMEKTFPITPYIRHLLHSDLDHMFGRNIQARNTGLVQGVSDHKLVWADLEL